MTDTETLIAEMLSRHGREIHELKSQIVMLSELLINLELELREVQHDYAT